jgi:ankyrin repeat protein
MLALLSVDSFEKKRTVADVKDTLETLPTGSDAYDSAYAAAMERIFDPDKDEDTRQLARKIMSWILCARRPLSTLELLHALAVNFGESKFNKDRIMDDGEILTVCAGLVTIDEKSDTVRFIHYTAQEYLQRNRQRWLPHANLEIAHICTAYLSLDDLSAGPCPSKQDYDHRVETLALLEYTVLHWGFHVSVLVEAELASETGRKVEKKASGFLSNARNLSSASQALFMSSREYFVTGESVAQEGEGFSANHWIGRFGLTLFFEKQTSGEAQWDSRDSVGRTPLSWATGEGHEALSKLLLETGKVDVDSKDSLGRTPLSWASGNGRKTLVKLLLDKEVDVDSKDDHGQTPLSWAAQEGQRTVVELLLSTNMVEVDSRESSGWTPLFYAVMRKDEELIQLLLSTRQVDVMSKSKYGGTPLSWAVKKGNEAVVKLLLDSGKVDLESKHEDGQTLLSQASERGQEAAVKLLLETGKVDVNSKDEIGQTPLLLAAKSKHEAVFKLLLDTGKVDIDWKDSFGKTALFWAARNGQEAIVKLLLNTGKVDVNSSDNYGWTPLRCATENGFGVIVKLLQDNGHVQVVSLR